MTTINVEQALAVLRDAELLCPAEAVTAALDSMATAITSCIRDRDPVIMIVMNGALIPAAHLLSRLQFPLQIDYLHVSRYRGATEGGKLHWIVWPKISVKDRTVLVIDDIFDEGTTLKAILEHLGHAGAQEVYSAVLVNKMHDRKEPGLVVDFIGLEVGNRYVFGCGMDYKDYWRNLSDIYAVRENCGLP
jgi:hypoxanthine phosphoribosyltransferase